MPTPDMQKMILDAIKLGDQLGGRHLRRSKRRNRRTTNKTKRRRR
jgi:hypothetical protein